MEQPALTFQTRSGRSYQYNPVTNRLEYDRAQFFDTLPPLQITFTPPPKITTLPRLSIFGLEITRECNLRCAYCCYSGAYRHQRTHEPLSLTPADIDTTLDFIAANRDTTTPLQLCFYGGEPLLKFDLIKYTIQRAQNRFGNDSEFLITSNGVFLTPEKLSTLAQTTNLTLNISLDGMPTLHDKNRRTTDGRPTFDTIHRNLQNLQTTAPDFFHTQTNFLITVEDFSLLPQISDFWDNDPLLKNKAPLSINPIAYNYARAPQTPLPPTPAEEHLATLYAQFDYYRIHPESRVMKSYFTNFLSTIKNRLIIDLPAQSSTGCCLPSTPRCFIDARGAIGICEKMCDTHRIGTLSSGIDYAKVNQYAACFHEIRNTHCSHCWALRLCDTCLTCLDLDKKELSHDCHLQKQWLLLSLQLFCEFAENKTLHSMSS
ncbi:MAG: radical SAM protein [Puniceicoccales bacterium]|jgi:uncharacterized protein|nr:radical SAM protein [Puniceicoccales bacterium]